MKKPGQKFWIVLSWLFLVVLPTAVVGGYYASIAANQYATVTRFALRSTDASGGLAAMLSKLSFSLRGGGSADSYIVKKYIHSREILRKLDKELNLREKFSKPKQDFWASVQPDISTERFLRYWRGMVEVHLDRVSNIFTVRVYAFSAEDARDITTEILRESERMINEISHKARKDALRYAENEVKKAEDRLRTINNQLLRFRSTTLEIDPVRKAQIQMSLIGKLNEEMAKLQAELHEKLTTLNASAPTIINLRNRIKSLRVQIMKEKQKLGSRISTEKNAANNEGLSTSLSQYENLLLERKFAEKIYVTALTGLEQARILANRQMRYLAVFERPYVPDESLYPKRVRNTIFVFIGLQLVWALGVLIVQSILDRL